MSRSSNLSRAQARKRTRMRPEARERLIVQGAIRYFSDHGLSVDTRGLARHLGVTHSLLYRYFPNKEALVERVFREVFFARWNPRWEVLIGDRSLSIRDRMREFFTEYARTVLDEDWVRIFFFAGLKGSPVNARFLSMMHKRVLLPLCRELRHSLGLPPVPDDDVTEYEKELVWGIIGRIIYFGVRKRIYQTPVPEEVMAHIGCTVDVFCCGAEAVLRVLLTNEARGNLVQGL